MDFSTVAVQVLGVATSICLCFMGYVGRRGVQWISVATCVLGVAQAALLDQVAVLVMSAVNLLYYTLNLFDERFALLRSTSYRVGAVLVSLFAAAYTQYFALGHGILSPATLAILGGGNWVADGYLSQFLDAENFHGNERSALVVVLRPCW